MRKRKRWIPACSDFPTIFLPIPKRISVLKGGCLDFSHLSELKNLYFTEIHMKKNNTNHQ